MTLVDPRDRRGLLEELERAAAEPDRGGDDEAAESEENDRGESDHLETDPFKKGGRKH